MHHCTVIIWLAMLMVIIACNTGVSLLLWLWLECSKQCVANCVSFAAFPIVVPNFHEDKGHTYKEGSSLDLLCVAQGYPTPRIHWRIGSNVLISSGDRCAYAIPPDLCNTETGSIRTTAENYAGCSRCPIADCSVYVVEELVDCNNNSQVVIVKSRLVIDALSTDQGGSFQCVATIGNTTTYNSTLIRVHSKFSWYLCLLHQMW